MSPHGLLFRSIETIRLTVMPEKSTPCIRFDTARSQRIGLPEAVFCEGKPRRALHSLLQRFAQDKNTPILFTRLSEDVFRSFEEDITHAYDYDALSRTAWNAQMPARSLGKAAIVSAGTADGAVAREVSRTLTYLGWTCDRFEDCGVAGLWRIQSVIDEINQADVIVVAAGLDAALASVLGGLTNRPLIAVPTSVGYGVAQGGQTALSSMLASCAPGVAVMNIDNGYGAACAAARILNALYPSGN